MKEEKGLIKSSPERFDGGKGQEGDARQGNEPSEWYALKDDWLIVDQLYSYKQEPMCPCWSRIKHQKKNVKKLYIYKNWWQKKIE